MIIIMDYKLKNQTETTVSLQEPTSVVDRTGFVLLAPTKNDKHYSRTNTNQQKVHSGVKT